MNKELILKQINDIMFNCIKLKKLLNDSMTDENDKISLNYDHDYFKDIINDEYIDKNNDFKPKAFYDNYFKKVDYKLNFKSFLYTLQKEDIIIKNEYNNHYKLKDINKLIDMFFY